MPHFVQEELDCMSGRDDLVFNVSDIDSLPQLKANLSSALPCDCESSCVPDCESPYHPDFPLSKVAGACCIDVVLVVQTSERLDAEMPQVFINA